MVETTDSLMIDGIELVRSDPDKPIYSFIPGAPVPERDTLGRPTLTLWVSGAGARLQLGTRWTVEERQLTRLHAALLARGGTPGSSRPDLVAAPVSVSRVVLGLGDGTGTWETLAETRSSGFSPFAAIFALALTAEQSERVTAALHGRAQFLRITYHAVRSQDVAVEAFVRGSVDQDLAALDDEATLDECHAQIEHAIEAGRLTLTVADGSEQLREQAREQALAKAARLLHQMARGGTSRSLCTSGEITLDATVVLRDTITQPIERTADLSEWWPNGGGIDHVRVIGTPLPELGSPVEAPSVRLGFDPTDSPVAFVELRHGDAEAVLRGPAFSAIKLTPGGDGPLTVTTHYTTGGKPYHTTVQAPGPSGWELTPADLGLQQITVDATERQVAGAREVRVRARYQSSGDGTDDDRTVYLRRDSWVVSWYLITRAYDLAGTIELEWKETAATGAVTLDRWSTNSNTVITHS